MTALYALPDHQVVSELLPGVGERFLDTEEALSRIAGNRGIVPLAIDPAGEGSIYWGDLGEYPFREWQFMYTVQHLARENAITDYFSTPFSTLKQLNVSQGLYPEAFIFHVSRCGSTLMAKAISRSPKNVVINQGGPLQRGFWAQITDDFSKPAEPTAENLDLFRRLVLAMARPRQDGQERAFVKLISWNTLYADFITKAFPDVPCIFLYREPVEVIASVLKETTAVLEAKGTRQSTFLMDATPEDAAKMSDVRYLARCYAKYFETILAMPAGRVTCLNYRDFSSNRFADVLERGISYCPDRNELEQMLEQFQFHSKDDADSGRFKPDSQEKQSSISAEDKRIVEEECAGLMAKLDAAPGNLYSTEQQSEKSVEFSEG